MGKEKSDDSKTKVNTTTRQKESMKKVTEHEINENVGKTVESNHKPHAQGQGNADTNVNTITSEEESKTRPNSKKDKEHEINENEGKTVKSNNDQHIENTDSKLNKENPEMLSDQLMPVKTYIFDQHITESERRKYPYLISITVVWILSLATRLYKISDPPHICWDETHFGKFANHYLNGTFFFDVHPPLGKMLLAIAGWMSGYKGGFPFDKPGDPYGDHNYTGMRIFCALLGGFCVPLAYLIVWELTRSLPACILASCLLIFDTGSITISQYILLDPILMFFMMMSIFGLLKFYSWRDYPFSIDWWGWMCCTGYFLACTFSVKWVGLFVILFAGVMTVKDLWDILGDLSISMYVVAQHLFARVIGLIILPIMVYLFFFGVHFQALPLSGPGDGFFSSAFQSTLHGNLLHKASLPKELAYGSIITLKNNKPGGSLLHSHHHLYPKEHLPEYQQITGYSHKDPNNDWVVKKALERFDPSRPLEYVKDGDVIRLEHIMTKRNLHSHNEKAPLTRNLLQVAGYGEQGEGDANDFWKIVVISGGGEENRIQTVKTVFRLIHVNTGCALAETDKTLPKWGWEQREMACSPITYYVGTLWAIEGNVNERVPKTSMELLAPSFLQSVYESHVVMAQTNSGFKPKEGEVTSQPWHWPINYRGQAFSGADNRIYLLGNPIIWWLIFALFGVFVIIYGYHAVREQRKLFDISEDKERRQQTIKACCFLLLGWAFHYLPFYVMGRVLYFHHYFPAFLFSAMFAGVLLDFLLSNLAMCFVLSKTRQQVYYSGILLIILICVVSFYFFRGLSYGMSGPMGNQPNQTMAAYRWLDSWDI